mgnify:FL=1
MVLCCMDQDTFVVSDDLAEIAGDLYVTLAHFVEDCCLEWSRKGIPSLRRFIRVCEEGSLVSELFHISDRELEAILGPGGMFNLYILQTTKPLLRSRQP